MSRCCVSRPRSRAGGNIRTTREDGLVFEWGPNGFLDNEPATRDLIRRVGIEQRLLVSNQAAAKRFIFRNGKLNPVSGSPLALLRSGFLVVSPASSAACASRSHGRSGTTPTSRPSTSPLAGSVARRPRSWWDAMVSGVYAGDARRLSLRAAFPKMWQMEHDHGSLFRAMLAKKKEAKANRAPGPVAPPDRPAA